MPKTEIQTLMTRIGSEYIRTHGFDPKTQKVSDVPESAWEFFWSTSKVVANLYEARRERTPDQRIVRKATAKFPATIVDKVTRVGYHVFDNPVTPIAEIRAAALSRRRGCGSVDAAI
jgi:hypothetical protein